MNYQNTQIKYHGILMDTYQTLDGRVWITLPTFDIGLTVKDWLVHLKTQTETLQVGNAVAYPLSVTIIYLNYLVECKTLKSKYFTASDVLKIINTTKKKADTKGYVYLLNLEGTNDFQIGYSTTKIARRIKDPELGDFAELVCIICKYMDDAVSFTREMQLRFNERQTISGWFSLTTSQVQLCIATIESLA